ncbi:hypothetical protein HGM15179_017287 [Zosterops borbonicus]|uniref:Rna-directed dna polymerase from mobile element jockey-like n=1 Tax=Zosterops borbonicus TaxID=364589 RepID=A0A8K1G1D5_9PASS|nr:hypothetical protein HGM15179_017287 [Zosterops borbonicus]
MDSVHECNLSKFSDDTKLCRALEGRGAVQRDLDSPERDLTRPERWACVNLIKFNKANCKVLYMGQDSHKDKQSGQRMDQD